MKESRDIFVRGEKDIIGWSAQEADLIEFSILKRYANRDTERLGLLLDDVEEAMRRRLEQTQENEKRLRSELNALQSLHEALLASTSYRLLRIVRRPLERHPVVRQYLLRTLRTSVGLHPKRFLEAHRRRKQYAEDIRLITQSGLFDSEYYVKLYPEVAGSRLSPIEHYVQIGGREGRRPHALFDGAWYLTQSQQIRELGKNPLVHFLRAGIHEGLNPNPFFDTHWYLSQMGTTATDGVNPLRHYLEEGAKLGLSPSSRFDAKWYLEQNPDVAHHDINPLVHYLDRGRSEGRNPTAGEAARGKSTPITDAEILCMKAPSADNEMALFVTHSPDGYLKPHVLHYLVMLKRHRIDVVLIVAADCPFRESEPELLSMLGGLFVRENKGFDFAAWAHVLRLCPDLFNAPALYLLNDSLFGPTNDLAFGKLLERVRSSEADVVGMTDNYEIEWHIQSYFIVIKRNALISTVVREFFGSVVSFREKDDVIRVYEVKFAPTLKAAGLICEALFPSVDKVNPTVFHWKRLIRAGFPFVKVQTLRDSFGSDDWRSLMAAEGYDVGLAERTLMMSKLQKLLARWTPVAADQSSGGTTRSIGKAAP